MKRFLGLTMVLGLILFSGVAFAGDTATVNVSAKVVGTCKFKSGGTITFNLDPSVGGNVSGTVTQPTFWCTKGASYTITDKGGLNDSGTIHRMKHESLNEYIPYSFTYTYTASGTGKGPNAPITMEISSEVLGADYLNASAGNYSDTVTLEITP